MEGPNPPPPRKSSSAVLILVNILIIGGLVVGLWAWARSRNAPACWTTHHGEGWSIGGPGDWVFIQDRKKIASVMPAAAGVSFLLIAPQTSRVDGFRENVNLVIQDLGHPPPDLDAYVALSTQQLESTLSAKILESVRRVAKEPDGVDSHRFLSAVRLGGRDLKLEQICRVVEEKAYLLTFTAKAAEFERWQPVAERILESFVLDK